MNHLPTIAGVEITTDAFGRFNLNALHRASGLPDTKAPNQWLRTGAAQELVTAFKNQTANSQSENEDDPVSVINGGAAPGTFAHELIAISYAGWISPAFQLQVNQAFIDYRTGKLAPAAAQVPADPFPALSAMAFALEHGLFDSQHTAPLTRQFIAALSGFPDAPSPATLPPIAAPAPRKVSAAAQRRQVKHRPTTLALHRPESLFNVQHDQFLPLTDIAPYLSGSYGDLLNELRRFEFIDRQAEPLKAASGFYSRRGGVVRWRVRATLRAIGVQGV